MQDIALIILSLFGKKITLLFNDILKRLPLLNKGLNYNSQTYQQKLGIKEEPPSDQKGGVLLFISGFRDCRLGFQHYRCKSLPANCNQTGHPDHRVSQL